MESNYNFLISRLDDFIRKYYKNQLLKGSIYAFAGLLILFLLINILEYFGQFNSLVRSGLFYSFILFTSFILVRYIALPLSRMWRIGKVLSYEQASSIIGQHFPEVKDKLLNILQLHNAGGNSSSQELVQASIDQKIGQIKPVPFVNAINLSDNLKYLKYAAAPLLLFIGVMIIAPSMITDSAERLVNHRKNFPKKAPFEISIENKNLQAVQQEDFELKVKVNGKLLPDEVFVMIHGTAFKMRKENKNSFSYAFHNLQKDINFQLAADEFSTDDYLLKVLARPQVLHFSVQLDYPAYLNKKSETLSNAGDLNIPAGTRVTWKFNTRHVSGLSLGFQDTRYQAEQGSDNHFSFSKRFSSSNTYYIKTFNTDMQGSDSTLYQLHVIPDAYPLIHAESYKDSTQQKLLYFTGEINDDHGFKKLQFSYSFLKKDGKALDKPETKSIPLQINHSQLRQNFYHSFDLSDINIQAGDEVEYYFEVWDNDGVNGSKSARSQTLLYKAPGLQEIKDMADANSQQLQNKMNEAIKEARNLQKEMKSLQEKLLDKKELSWEEKKKMDELLKREKELEKKINNLKEQNQQNNKMQNEFSETDKNIMQKQQELEKMWNEVLDNELKEMLKKMEELMHLNNKEQMQEQLEKMELSNKDVEKELDRMLEMFKNLEVEKKLQDNIDALKKLQEKQDQLAEQNKKNQEAAKNKEIDKAQQEKKAAEIKQEQEKLNKEFKEIRKDLKELDKKNQELEKPKEVPDTREEQEQIEQSQEESQEQMSKKDDKKAAKKQKEAAEKMEEMSKKLQEAKDKMENKEQEENYETLRELLENLVQLSKDQEELMQQMATVQGYNPQFVKMGQRQKEIKDNARMVEDSLLALSKRVPQISSYINRELSQVNFNMQKTLEEFADRNIYAGRARQQHVMTSVNNIAVMLSEVLKQMQEDMKNNSKSQCNSGMCKKPGKKPGNKKSPSLSDLMKMQGQLNEQMKNGQKPGNKEGMGSRQFAEMAAKQAAIRRQIQKLQQQAQKEGNGQMGNQLQQIQQLMEQSEKELVNKQLNRQTLERQQDIETRMLESDKAEKEKETENKRESKQAQEKPRPVPPAIEQFLRQKNKENELLITIPPALKGFYKEKSKEYFMLIR